MQSVKAVGDFELDVLAIPFDSVDSDGQWFDANTDIMPEHFNTPVGIYQHGVEQGAKGYASQPTVIGRTVPGTLTKQSDGWHIRMMIDSAGKFAKSIIDAAKNGLLAVSSGAVGHLARLDVDGKIIPYEKNKPGRIAAWSLAEVSLWERGNGNMRPANNMAYAVPALKALYASAGLNFEIQPEDAGNAAADKSKSNSTKGIKMDEQKSITPEDVQAQIAAALKAEREANEAAVKAAKDFEAAVEAKAAEKVEAIKADMVKGRRLPDFDGVAPYATKYAETKPYDNMDAGDAAVMIGTLKSAGKRVSDSAYKALALKLEEDKTEAGEQGRYAMKSAGIKAGELNYSTSGGYGDEWVGIAYSASLWESIRVNTFVVSKLPQIEVPQGHESIYLPLESTDPVWYNVAENTANGTTTGSPAPTITSSRVGTGRQLLTLSKLGARVTWSGEIEEASLIPFASQVRMQLAKSGAEYLESAIIDGDTETTDSTNINNIGGAEVTGGHYLAFDGFRKSCLVTTAANSRAGGTLSVEDFLETAKLMGGAGINALDTSKVSFIIDPNVNWKFISLPEFLTRDVSGNPTLEGGKLSQIWGYGVNVSGAMHFMSAVRKANSAGKVNTTTPADNLYGAILAVRWDQWKMGWQRRITMETTRFANSDTNEIVAMLRVGLKQRDTEASAITYGVTV